MKGEAARIRDRLPQIRTWLDDGLSTSAISTILGVNNGNMYRILKTEKVPIPLRDDVLRGNKFNFQGGMSQGYYRKCALATRPPICEVCGADMKRKRIDVHHIDKDHLNNHPDNLLVLCCTCHMTLHYEAGDFAIGRYKPMKEVSEASP